MKNQDRIDDVLKKVLRTRQIEPEMVRAYAEVIKALAVVPEREESENTLTEDDDSASELLRTFSSLEEIKEVEIDGRKHPINIIPPQN